MPLSALFGLIELLWKPVFGLMKSLGVSMKQVALKTETPIDDKFWENWVEFCDIALGNQAAVADVKLVVEAIQKASKK